MARTSWGLGGTTYAVLAVALAIVVGGCGSDDERSATQEVESSLRAANVADVEIQECEPEEDPEGSEFALYRCSVIAGDAVTFAGDHDRLPAGSSVYCFNVPRLPHGGGTDPIDVDAYPAWAATDGGCFG
jgi:hypothetical protein